MSCLYSALETMAIGTAYAVWIGVAGSALVGIGIFQRVRRRSEWDHLLGLQSGLSRLSSQAGRRGHACWGLVPRKDIGRA